METEVREKGTQGGQDRIEPWYRQEKPSQRLVTEVMGSTAAVACTGHWKLSLALTLGPTGGLYRVNLGAHTSPTLAPLEPEEWLDSSAIPLPCFFLRLTQSFQQCL